MKYKIFNDIIDSEIAGSFYLLNIKTGKYLKLNTPSMFIFNSLKADKDNDIIISDIVKKYNLTTDKAKNDFDYFISLATKFEIIKTLDD